METLAIVAAVVGVAAGVLAAITGDYSKGPKEGKLANTPGDDFMAFSIGTFLLVMVVGLFIRSL